MKFLKFVAVIIILAWLSACRAGFPTEKFVRPENGVNWHLIFMNGGRWEGYYDGNLITYGSYRTDGNQLYIESDSQCEELGAPIQAVYSWSYSDDSLSLQPDGTDGCAERQLLLAGGPFTVAQ